MISNTFFKNIIILLSGNVVARVLPLFLMPIITRIYTPTDLGYYSLFTVTVGIISIILSGRFEQAVLIVYSERRIPYIFVISILFGIIMLTFFYSFSFLYLYFLKGIPFDFDAYTWFILIPITSCFLFLFNFFISYVNRLENFYFMSYIYITKSFSLSISQIVLGLFNNGYMGLVYGMFISQLFSILQLTSFILKKKFKFIKNLKSFKIKVLIAILKKFKNFPFFNLPHAILTTIINVLPIYGISYFYGKETVGYYSLALTVGLTPFGLVATSISKVFNAQLTQKYRKKEDDIYRFTISFLSKLFMIFLPIYTIIFFIVPKIFGYVFGERWSLSGEFMQIMGIYVWLNFIVSIISYIPSIKNRQKKAFFISAIHFILLSLCFIILGSSFSIEHFLVSISIINLGVLTYNFFWILKLIREDKYENIDNR